jgi:hypothetical protein
LKIILIIPQNNLLQVEDNMTEEWHLLVRLFSFVVISVAYPGIPTFFLHTSLYFLVRLLGR